MAIERWNEQLVQRRRRVLQRKDLCRRKKTTGEEKKNETRDQRDVTIIGKDS